ncbi:UDP-N-acetylglucosamine 1-carboxyvinyltransferase [Demequina mangrovi]|uniref:UDP-N-acetylglucosamine 1-carboxyvinyltransferase n=1 Tax=Demequina mangrovi TaxID=1043493 RepID=A0A1H6V902_9MICO|nr:UDP-N-acetylglucosamine 1-carboxyvinyltransferase [Demequina mangrovi]SEJ00306.1 UDP-N-acetylglucosamine 1-carboxyvinyltransferase [Demequina mangrovi]
MTDSIRVTGGRPLTGDISVRGAKNFVSKAMVAALLGSTPSTLRNVPDIRDVAVVSSLLRLHGAGVEYDVDSGVLTMDTSELVRADAAQIAAHAGSSRIPILLCGPLLHRLGEAVIPDLGGCRIGDRPIDFHLEILQKFGATVTQMEDGLYLTAPNGLKGIKHKLEYPSVGATEQLLLTAVMAEGITHLEGAAVEPEIKDLIDTLQKMGAIISVSTDRSITIEGVARLHGYDHVALTDRIEVGSWAAAALATKGDIFVHGAQQRTMGMFLNVFRKVGGEFEVVGDGIRFYHPGGDLKSIALQTDVHPGFMTDWQQPLVVALTQAKGLSIVHETVYENRFGFTDALNQMGAQVQLFRECLGDVACRFGARNFQHSAVISGPTPLAAADIEVPDLRGGFSHLIAALAAEGTSTVRGIGIIDRGYEGFRDKLAALGAEVE